MKPWEKQIKEDNAKGDTYTVVFKGDRWLCNLIDGEYIAKDGLNTKLTNVSNIIKL